MRIHGWINWGWWLIFCTLSAWLLVLEQSDLLAQLSVTPTPEIETLPSDQNFEEDDDDETPTNNLLLPFSVKSVDTVFQTRPQESSRPMDAFANRSRFAKPSFTIAAEWEPEASGIAVGSFSLSTRIPTFPIFGPPPPFITARVSLTDIDAPAALDLPSEVYNTSIGLAWMRRMNDQWMVNFMFNAGFSSDLENKDASHHHSKPRTDRCVFAANFYLEPGSWCHRCESPMIVKHVFASTSKVVEVTQRSPSPSDSSCCEQVPLRDARIFSCRYSGR